MALTNSQYNAIMRNYSEKQFKNKAALDVRYEEVVSRLPEFSRLEDEISSLSVSQAKRLIMGEAGVLESYRNQMTRLKERRKNLLASGNFPEDYLKTQYDCPHCQDTGYIGNKKCSCFIQEEIDLLYTQANLKEILARENFSTFSTAYYSEKLTDADSNATALELANRALEQAQAFVDHFGKTNENLLLYGNTGVGKTFLTNCIAKELLDRRFSVLYFSSAAFFELLAKNTFEQNLDEKDTSSYIFNCDLLIIDDLGTEMANSFVLSKFFDTINRRLLAGKSMLISTNLSVEALKETYTERSFSRILGNYILVKLIGNDIRIQKKLNLTHQHQ